MRYLGLILITLILVMLGCKGGGTGDLDAPTVDATGDWEVQIVDAVGATMGTMTFVKTGANTFEADWDDAVDEFTATLTIGGSGFTLGWVSEWTQGGSECQRTTEITGTISQNTMTGSGTETAEVVSGPDPGFDGDVDQLQFSADREI